MKNLAMLVAGVVLGAVVLMLVAQPTVEEPATETPTVHTSYRPVITTPKPVRSASSSKRSTSVVGSWEHEESIRETMGDSASKYRDVRLQSKLTLLDDG